MKAVILAQRPRGGVGPLAIAATASTASAVTSTRPGKLSGPTPPPCSGPEGKARPHA